MKRIFLSLIASLLVVMSACAITADGDLVLHWDYSSDTNPVDLSGNGNDGTLAGTGQPVWSGSDLPAAYVNGTYDHSQDGDDDWIEAATSASLDTMVSGDFSGGYWVRADAQGESSKGKASSMDGTDLFCSGYNGSGNRWTVERQGSSDQNRVTSTTVATPDTWVHVFYSYDSSTTAQTGITIYIDGAEASYFGGNDGSGLSSATGHKLVIGAETDGGFFNFNGDIAYPSFWKRILTLVDVADIYNNGITYGGGTITPVRGINANINEGLHAGMF